MQRAIELLDLRTYDENVDKRNQLQYDIKIEQQRLGRDINEDAKMLPGFLHQCILDTLNDKRSVIITSIEFTDSEISLLGEKIVKGSVLLQKQECTIAEITRASANSTPSSFTVRDDDGNVREIHEDTAVHLAEAKRTLKQLRDELNEDYAKRGTEISKLAVLKTNLEYNKQRILFIQNQKIAVDYKLDDETKQYFHHLKDLNNLTNQLMRLDSDINFTGLRQNAPIWIGNLVKDIQAVIDDHEIDHPQISLEARSSLAKLKQTCTVVADEKSQHDAYTRYFALRGCLITISSQIPGERELAAKLNSLLLSYDFFKKEDCITAYTQLGIPSYSEQEIVTREMKAYNEAKAAFDRALTPHKASLQPKFKEKYRQMSTIMSTGDAAQLNASRNYFTQIYQAATQCLADVNPDNRAGNFTKLLNLSTKIKDEQPESNTREKILAVVGAIVAIVSIVLSLPLTFGLSLPAVVPAIAPIGAGLGAAFCAFFSYKANSADKRHRGLSKAIIDVHDSLDKVVKPLTSAP